MQRRTYDNLLKAPNKEAIREVEKCLSGYSKVQGPGVSHDVVEANKKEPKKVEEGGAEEIKVTKMSKEDFEAIKGPCIRGKRKVKENV